MLQRLERLAFPALLVVLIVAFYWKLSLTTQFDWMWSTDQAQQVLPWYEEEARQMHAGIFPLWDPHGWGGQPLLALGQPGGAYPFNWLLFLLPSVHGHISTVALAWYYIAIHAMAGLFSYMLCRDVRLSGVASVVGGLIFALASYVGTVAWPQMLNGAIWAPLVFLFLIRTVRGSRPLASAAMCGMVSGMSWLSGHHQAPMFISMAAGFTWIWHIARLRSWKMAVSAGTFAVFLFLTAALQVLPASEYARLAKRWVSAAQPVGWKDAVPYSVHGMFSLSPVNVFGTVIPGLGGAADPFIGTIALALAALAVATAWNRPAVRLFTALAIGAFVYAMGSHDVFQGMLYATVPFLNMARVPAMALIVFALGAAVLAAHGVDRAIVLRESLVVRRIALVLLGFGLFVWIAVLCVSLARNGGPYEAPAMTGLIAIAAGAFLIAWTKKNVPARTAGVLLIGLLLMELGSNSPPMAHRDDSLKMADLRHMRGYNDIAQFLNRQTRPFRVDMETEEVPVSWPSFNNFDEIKTAGASITVNRAESDFWSPQNRSMMGVEFTIGRATSMPDAQEVFQGASGLKVFRNPHAFPRAWAVHDLARVPTRPEGQALIRDHVEEMHSKAFTVGAGPPAGVAHCSAADTVLVKRYQPQYVSIEASMACDGMVVLSDTFYPGWNVTVDGKPARVWEVNLTMRGVLVPKGAHEIEYRYRPGSVYAGAVLSAIGIVGACFIYIRR